MIETARNVPEAMLRLRHFSSAISVVVLDMDAPGGRGIDVLHRMQNNTELRTIPVIVVGADGDHQTLLKVIEGGAADYVIKPVDADIIRIRVKSAVSKAENERLLAQNSYLQLQRDEELKYHTVLESTGTVVIEYDWRNHVFVYTHEISKYIAGNYNHRSLWQIFLSDMVADSADVKALQDGLLTLANDRDQKTFSRLAMLRTPENLKHWFRVSVYKRADDFGLAEKMIITFNDVHEEVLANEKLRFQATRDELTGLYNRAGFIEKATEMIAAKEAGYYVVSCIDIERFKVINDQYGTKMGDEVLRRFAQALSRLQNLDDCICCRVMADNFAMLYPKQLINSPELAEIHREADQAGGLLPNLKIYVGRCAVDNKALDISTVYDRATIAKETVKGRYDMYMATYDESMRTSMLRQQEITGQMKHALESGQFEVWLQPQFNHATGMLSGAEALVRWRHPQEGIISPGEFIPIFEENGFVYEVDKFVWERTCQLLRKWLNQGVKPVPVSVNISRYDVFRDDLVGVIKSLVEKYRLPKDLLRLEITESAFAKSADQIIRVVKELIDLGFIVEIDDFGSGYSSLNTLKDVPAQVLKMDMRFLENDSNVQRGGSIIESVVRMARWLGMTVIAEGVETLEQADYLKSIGCEYVQGYLYSKPAQISDYEKIFTSGKTESMLGKLKTVETWNNNAFWNPMSMETLIFNSYVGGACIFEYHNEKAELLRYNASYADIFRGCYRHGHSLAHADILSRLDQENAALFTAAIREAIRTKKEASCELVFYGDNVTAMNIRVTLRQIADAEDRSLFYCVVYDITKQRAAERGEREAASRVAAIMDNAAGGITAVCLKDGKTEMVFSNDRYYLQLGYTREQFQKEVPLFYNAIYPEDRPGVWQKVHETLTSRQPCSVEYRGVKRDGSIIHIRSNIALCRIDGIEGDVIITVESDISELYAARQNEQAAAERIRAVMDNATCGITAVVLRDDETTEYLLVNDQYFHLVGYTREQYASEGFSGLELMHPDDLKEYRKQIIGLNTVGQTGSFEFRARRRDGQWAWLRDDLAVISLDGVDRPVQLSCFTDITARKAADENLRFLNELAGTILAQPDNDKAIHTALARLMAFFGGDRGYIVELDYERGLSRNTYEVCAENVISEQEYLQSLPFSTDDFWYDTLAKHQFLVIDNVNGLGEDKAALRELLRAQHIRSLALAPLWRDGVLIGFAGVDNPTRALEQMERLTAPADYLAVLLTRRDLKRDVERGNAAIGQMIDDTPGGFCRIAIHPDQNPTLVNLNQGFCRMLGMTEAEIRAVGGDILQCLAEDDVAASREDARKARASGGQLHTKCRLRRKDGDYLWVMVYGRFVDDENGNTFLNAYFTDITEQKEAEELRVNLLDNLTCGVALYECDSASVSVIHINKSYWKLVGRDPLDYTNANVLDMVHAEDRPVVMQEMISCIRQHRNFSADLRVRNGKGGYSPFHVTATVIPEPNGKYLFYAAYMPISDQVMSVQEMLPIALSTMMASSEDISFIKDQDGRYICCSQAALDALKISDKREIIGKTSAQVFGDSVVAQFAKEDRQVYETGKPLLDREITLPTRIGTVGVFCTSKYPLLDGTGKVVGVYCVCRDVTTEKATEFELNTLLRVIPSGVIKYSADEKAEFAYVNRNFVESLGYTEEQFRAKYQNCFRNMIWKEDRARAEAEILVQENEGKIGRFDYRVEAADGRLHWFHDEGVKITDQSGKAWYYVTLVDVTAQKKSDANLRLAEEEYRLATRHSGHTIGRYDIASHTLTITEDAATRLALPERIPDVPYGRVRLGKISEATSAAYIALYESIMRGEKESTATFQKLLSGGWRWITERATTIFDDEGKPVSAIISYTDVTEQQEKEIAYKRWQQSMKGKKPETYTLFRCNLNKNVSYDIQEGKLLSLRFDDSLRRFNDRTTAYAQQYVYEGDRDRYLAFVNSDTMMAEYYRGHRADELEYREKTPDGNIRWLKLSVDLVEVPHSTDVEAYLLYENIDERKRAELEARHMAETDPLTGLYNRKTFSEKVNELIKQSKPGVRHAFMMLDIDGFKLLNDTFGHAAGDEALIEASQKLLSLLRKGDLLGRLGGDEFVLFLQNISGDMDIGEKAERICRYLRKVYNADVCLSASIGVSLYPKDGQDSHTLYEKADTALYAAKENGRNTYRVYSSELPEKNGTADQHDMDAHPGDQASGRVQKRRLLLADADDAEREQFKALLSEEFIVDVAPDAHTALSSIRYYGSALSIVLLDIRIQGMEDFAMLKRITSAPEMRGVPVVVITGAENRETTLRAVQNGATDFITKPVDPELIRLRIDAAVSRAENQRLRAQNSYLQLQGEEITRYQIALGGMDMFVAELDWIEGTFVYDPDISRYLKGNYNGRTLWDILLSDGVADASDVLKAQDYVRELTEDRQQSRGRIELPMQTPAGARHRFCLTMSKALGEDGTAHKLVIVFQDLGDAEASGDAIAPV